MIPQLLTEIPDPPKKLYKRGNLPDPTMYTYLTVIGSRKYTTYGKNVCEALLGGLRGYPIVIVSGLALGMDTIAHKTALHAGLRTVAIPGSGLDPTVLYPASNRQLADDIVAAGGAIISEYDPLTPAAQWTFPQRNRLMAGISTATLVIEAGNKSGTRITAKLATEYNRDVLAVPGSIFSEVSEGTNQLLREGATPVTSAEDVLAILGFDATDTPMEDMLAGCNPDEQQVIRLLASPMSKGDLIRALDMEASDANALLAMMEINGLIKETLGEVHRC